MMDQMTGHEIAGNEIAGHENVEKMQDNFDGPPFSVTH